MRVFIIRPFNIKLEIDFERVECELIQPALRLLGDAHLQVSGSTTALITKSGNIREDMFRMIAVADLVIADISIHNANVYYELGIRHALTPRATVMIRSRTEHPHPFDLQTDRYFSYDAANPQASVAALLRTLKSTLASPAPDSPLFQLLPQLAPHGRGNLISVPDDFHEDVERASDGRHFGTLRLLAYEAGAFEWDQEGLYLIGNAQLKLRAYAGACDTFELLLQTQGDHNHANLRLGTIYQRLAALETGPAKAALMKNSTLAIKRVIAAKSATANELVEAHCLLGSNEKSRWIDELTKFPTESALSATLHSEHFTRMQDEYLLAANMDLNAHYPAINALAALKIRIHGAQSLPGQWQAMHADEAEATAALAALVKLVGRLTASLELALELDELMAPRTGLKDGWQDGSQADFKLLTSSQSPLRVAAAYRKALTGSDLFTLEASLRNLDIYRNLGMFEPGLSAAINEIMALEAMRSGGAPPAVPAKVLLFSGHMVDAVGTVEDKRRFPPTLEAEARARALIREAVQRELAHSEGLVLGIASGACGGDLLFHEVCAELGVRTRVYLALSEKLFQANSVQRGGPRWVERYLALLKRSPPLVLQATEAPPNWLRDKPDYDVWTRTNLWMMFSALGTGSTDLTLLALYNRDRANDGPGGTAHLLNTPLTMKKGFKLVELDARLLL